jgi:hypothetical protein
VTVMGTRSKRSMRRQQARSRNTTSPSPSVKADNNDNRVAYHFASAILKARGLDLADDVPNKMAFNAA